MTDKQFRGHLEYVLELLEDNKISEAISYLKKMLSPYKKEEKQPK